MHNIDNLLLQKVNATFAVITCKKMFVLFVFSFEFITYTLTILYAKLGSLSILVTEGLERPVP